MLGLARSLLLWCTVGCVVGLAPTVSHAGDPCPIQFRIYDLGTPAWHDRDALLDKLETQRPWIGLSYRDRTGGVYVSEVFTGSPAEKAGLRKLDVITKVGAAPVTTQADVGARLDPLKPGDNVSFTYLRGAKQRVANVVVGRWDPLIHGLVTRVQGHDECTDITLDRSQSIRDAALAKSVFADGKRFRCDDAHKALAKQLPDENAADGRIAIVRGGRRVLLALAGWKTLCVQSSAYDGSKLTKAALVSLFERLTSGLVSHRHRYP